MADIMAIVRRHREREKSEVSEQSGLREREKSEVSEQRGPSEGLISLSSLCSQPRRCDACGLDPAAEVAAGRPGAVLIAMEPGSDGAPWWLCARCYS